jgi:uncharacterized membrane protein YebE (DUF533 family)
LLIGVGVVAVGFVGYKAYKWWNEET